MEKGHLNKLFLVVPLIMVAFLSQTPKAYADFWEGRRHDYRGHHEEYPHHQDYPYGRVVASLGRSFISVFLGPERYYYCDGNFYRHQDRDYIVVPAPRGVIVSSLPTDAHLVIIDGVYYHVYNGVYYRPLAQGYEVIDPPTPVVIEQATVAANIAPQVAQDSFVVNIPNTQGGYTSVTIKKSGNGFTGPQGEFYTEFPKLEQLRVMYVKI